MSWICIYCETENDDNIEMCEVCGKEIYLGKKEILNKEIDYLKDEKDKLKEEIITLKHEKEELSKDIFLLKKNKNKIKEKINYSKIIEKFVSILLFTILLILTLLIPIIIIIYIVIFNNNDFIALSYSRSNVFCYLIIVLI
ncbi:MAG: hypothetical protein LBQ77_02765 [Treponema sp.]|jgi:FtsZ-binding cell division protein ZapB|nr:hypothetical protein [Treponema sp.]